MAWRKFIWTAVALHLVAIVLHNTRSTLAGYHAVYASTGARTLPESTAIRLLDRLLQWAPLALHARLSGIETGYGFFAPQVASQYLTRFTLLDTAGDTIRMLEIPYLQKKESQLRYAGFLDAMQVFTEDTTTVDSYERRYARALLQSMAERIARLEQAATVRCQVLVYRHPSLRDRRDRAPVLIPVYAQTFPIDVP